MKSKSIILIAVSLGFGLVAAIGISQVMGRSNNATVAKKEETKPVLVSLADIDIHGELAANKVSIERWPANLVPPDAISSLEEIKDMVTNCRVAKKMPILKQMAIHKTQVNAIQIPKGFKVVAIKLPADDVISGLLNPGDVVDLIGVFTTDKQKVSRTFLTNIRVFSINSKTAPDLDRGKQTSQGAVVGFLMTKSQAEKLILAQKVAQIKLVLGSEDKDKNPLAAANDSGNPNGASMDDFGDNPEPMEKPDGDDSLLSKLLSGNKSDAHEVIHQMVMVTPDGPISYVFHKDSPLPQKIEGYMSPAPSKKAGKPAGGATSKDDDLIDPNDSVISGEDSVDNGEMKPAEDSGSAEESNPATNEQEDQFNAP